MIWCFIAQGQAVSNAEEQHPEVGLNLAHPGQDPEDPTNSSFIPADRTGVGGRRLPRLFSRDTFLVDFQGSSRPTEQCSTWAGILPLAITAGPASFFTTDPNGHYLLLLSCPPGNPCG